MSSRACVVVGLAALVPLASCSLAARAASPRAGSADGVECGSVGAPLADLVASAGLAVAARALLDSECPESSGDVVLGGGPYVEPGLGCSLGQIGVGVVGGGALIGSLMFAGSAAAGFGAVSSCHGDDLEAAPSLVPAVAPRVAPAPADPELDRLVAAYGSGLPTCDDYVRAFASMQRCPVLAVKASSDGRRTMLIAMMARFAEQGRLDPIRHAAAREQAARRCQSGADEVRTTLSSLSCTVEPDGRATEVGG